MSQEIMIRGLMCGLYSIVFAWIVFSRHDVENSNESLGNNRPKYLPYISGILLPAFLAIVMVLGGVVLGAEGAARFTLSMCFSIFLHISVYYILLILMLPICRRVISARACAMLWMIPNYLYIIAYQSMEVQEPWIVISAPGRTAWILFFLWFLGFITVLIWKTIEHLRFRRLVLADAVLVTDYQILEVWERVLEDARIRKPKFELVTSPNMRTPLSVGLFRSRMKVILPAKDYSPEELELIFRHEVIHISREDSWSKYFLVFCTAMCWFNPLMWIAMKKSAEDMELSCDETALLEADEDTRDRYARLLLDHAGDGRGFTTCLSATAKAMRHRLKNITKPVSRRSGALVVGISFFILSMTSGYVALAYDARTGAQVIYQSGDYEQYALRYVNMEKDEYDSEYGISDEKAFHEYLSGLVVSEFTGNYSFSENDRFTYIMEGPQGTMVITLYDHVLKITSFDRKITSSYYYIKEGVDWEYLNTLIVAYPAMNLRLTREGDPEGKDFSARLDKLWETAGDQKTLIFDSEYPEEETHGLFGYDSFDKVAFSFSREPAAPCSVLIESWDRSESYTEDQRDMTQPFVLTPPEYAAHYTVFASFHAPDGGLYEGEFRFDIGDIE